MPRPPGEFVEIQEAFACTNISHRGVAVAARH
jgi:hypothetical protein